MKKILILIVVLFTISFASCDNALYTKTQKYKNPETGEVTYVARGVVFHVIEIDGCEYLIGNIDTGYGGFGYMSHKGNCKYCAERRKRELQNLK